MNYVHVQGHQAYAQDTLQPLRLIVPALCSILTCSHFCCQMSLPALHDARAPCSERWNCFVGEKLSREFSLDLADFHIQSWILLHAVNL
jgi:hypothetical protein